MRTSDYFETKNQQGMSDSKHDEIVVWIYSKLKRLTVDAFKAGGMFDLKHDSLDSLELVKSHIQLECPLGNHRRGITGYADLYAQFELCYAYRGDNEDLLGMLKGGKARFAVPVLIEVKSHLKLTETIRQMKTYSSMCASGGYGPDGNSGTLLFVCAPPSPMAQIFKEQGIGFIPYEPEAK